jgi:hypothetical protein
VILPRRSAGSRPSTSLRGQSVVEFAMVLPFLMLLILGAVEFGFVFNANLSLEYASREGARVGSALANGGGPLGCGAGQSPNAAGVDLQIIQAVDRVLTSTGSPLNVPDVLEIRIFQATASGGEVAGKVNIWLPTPGAGPVVGGRALDFSPSSTGWAACSRTNAQPADSVGVAVSYRYRTQTPFARLSGMTTVSMYDKTIMALNPTS